LHSLDPNVPAPVSRGIEVLDLAAETRGIDSARDPERSARTLSRLETLRLTLISLQAGTKLNQHHTSHELSIQTISGHVSIQTPHERVNLPQGSVAVLERGLMHDVEANEASAILVTVSIQTAAGASLRRRDANATLEGPSELAREMHQMRLA
jgi:quercetin dioxygenase-like cupin family protein